MDNINSIIFYLLLDISRIVTIIFTIYIISLRYLDQRFSNAQVVIRIKVKLSYIDY